MLKYFNKKAIFDVSKFKNHEFIGPTLSFKLIELITSTKATEYKTCTVYTDEELKPAITMWSRSKNTLCQL
jgi:hypothetical protein